MNAPRARATPRPLSSWWLCAVVAVMGACRSEGREGERREAPRIAAETPAREEAPAREEPPAELHGVGGVEGQDPTYDQSRQPAKVIAALRLAPGQKVADVGAGLGYFTTRLADAVGPAGQVVATDIDDEVLKRLHERYVGRKNVAVRKVPTDDPGLEAGMYDLILLSEVDHFFPDRVAYLTRLRAALAPNGRIAVTHLRAMRPPLVAAAQSAGYAVVSEYNDLPMHYLLFLQPAFSQ